MPFKAFTALAFSRPNVSASDIVAILRPTYNAGKDKELKEDPGSKEEQEHFFKTVLPELFSIKEKEEGNEFLCHFVAFCTGLNYLPDPVGNPDFRIEVEFNFDPDFNTNDHLPKAHSCEKILVIPGNLYGGDKDAFSEKLEKAVMSSIGRFGMQ